MITIVIYIYMSFVYLEAAVFWIKAPLSKMPTALHRRPLKFGGWKSKEAPQKKLYF